MSDFFAKYRDPRWQRKRLEVMNAANFTCQECKATDVTLNVHHKIYHKGHDPWDYKDKELVCLCERCHECWHMLKGYANQLLVDLDESSIRSMVGYGIALALDTGAAKMCRLTSTEATTALARHFGLTHNQVLAIRDPELWFRIEDIRAIVKKKKGRRT